MGGLVWGWHGCRLGCFRNIVAKPLSFPFFLLSLPLTSPSIYPPPPINAQNGLHFGQRERGERGLRSLVFLPLAAAAAERREWVGWMGWTDLGMGARKEAGNGLSHWGWDRGTKWGHP